MFWLMKVEDDGYLLWSTVTDSPITALMTEAQALAHPDVDEERMRWTNIHLCSCRARLGETVVVRNGRAVAVGGGRLAYSFPNYERVREFLLSGNRALCGERPARSWEEFRAAIAPENEPTVPCRVYWGSHGCSLERGHNGPHECDCCTCVDHDADPLHGKSDPEDEGVLCVARPPYYGPATKFYGEDADA